MSSAILPEGVQPLKAVSPFTGLVPEELQDAFDEVALAISNGRIHESAITRLITDLSPNTLRAIVSEIAGTSTSFLVMFQRQLTMIDNVLNQMVYPDGRLKQGAEEHGITLDKALNMSLQSSKLIAKEIPNIYNIDRLQRLEAALSEVIEEFFTPEQRDKVLARIKELEG